MYTIKNDVVTEQFINKSRFITYLFSVDSESDAKNKLDGIRKKHYDANHNCYCYIIGETANIMKFSDDSEPSGTAGSVIYDVLQKNNLTNILAIVTRYFGGIKLGAGGLVRAYSSSTAHAVEISEKIEIIKYLKMIIRCDYSNLGIVEKYISDYDLLTKEFYEYINISIIVPETDIYTLETKLIDITKNTVEIKTISTLE